MGKYDKICEECLIEMFKRVGLDYSFEEILEYAKQDKDWYWLKAWTKEEEDKFTAWMDDKLKKMKWNKQTRAMEIGWFLLMWGWKRADPCHECGQVGFHKMSCGSKGES